MHTTLQWLGSFFEKWGVIAFWIAVIFAVLGGVLKLIASPLTNPLIRYLFYGAGISIAVFVLTAIFYVLSK